MKKMRNIILLLLLILQIAVVQARESVEVVKVITGDTIKIKSESGQKRKVHLDKITCPDTFFSFDNMKISKLNNLSLQDVAIQGIEAMTFLEVQNEKAQDIQFEFTTKNKGILYLDGIDIRTPLLQKGLCLSEL